MKPGTTFTLLALLLLSFPLAAQPGLTPFNTDDIAKIKQNVLAVVAEGPQERVVKTIKGKADVLANYQSSLDFINDVIKETVQKEWDISEEIKFISEAEAKKLKDDKTPGFSLLEVGKISDTQMGSFYDHPQTNFQYNPATDLAYHTFNAYTSVALVISNSENPKRELVFSYAPVYGVTKGTVTYMIRHLKNQVTDYVSGEVTSWKDLKRVVESKTAQVKTKTLLFFDPLISDALQKTIDSKEFEKLYAYKYEVVSWEKAESILIAKEKDYAIAWIVFSGLPGGAQYHNFYVIDAQDARQLFISGKAGPVGDDKFDKVHLTSLSKELK